GGGGGGVGVRVGRGVGGVGGGGEEPWAEAWQAHFRPLPVGHRLLVCPPWDVPDDGQWPGRMRVVIEPGRAFGTGGHASTRTCLQLLERGVDTRPGPFALDVGTGSGLPALSPPRPALPPPTP